MKRSQLGKLALLSLSAFLVFGCQAKGDNPPESPEMKEFSNTLPSDQRQKFSSMSDEEKQDAMQRARDVMRRFYDSLTSEQKQKFDQMKDERIDMQDGRESMRRFYDSLTPEQKQKFDQMKDERMMPERVGQCRANMQSENGKMRSPKDRT